MSTEPQTETAEPVTQEPSPALTGQSPEDYEATKWAKDSWFMRDRYPGAGFVRFTEINPSQAVLIRDSAVEVIQARENGGSIILTKGSAFFDISEPPIDVARLLATPYHLALDDDQPFGTEADQADLEQRICGEFVADCSDILAELVPEFDRRLRQCEQDKASDAERLQAGYPVVINLLERAVSLDSLAELAKGSDIRFGQEGIAKLADFFARVVQQLRDSGRFEAQDVQDLRSIAAMLQIASADSLPLVDLLMETRSAVAHLQSDRQHWRRTAMARRENLELIARLVGVKGELPDDAVGASAWDPALVNVIRDRVVQLLQAAQKSLTAKVEDAGLAEHRAELAAQAARARAGLLTAHELHVFWKAMPSKERLSFGRSLRIASMDDNQSLQEENWKLHSSNEALREANRGHVAKEQLLLERNRQAQRCITDYLEGIAALQQRIAVLESRLAIYEPREASPEQIEAETTAAHSVPVEALGDVGSDG